ncbi:hypothetical protein C8Q80DRAFT_32806 [Daedaleopsis nitida]|nr:hypothetical protein C8Q80DRAFT_32806 [Daedaleopsis nitida]
MEGVPNPFSIIFPPFFNSPTVVTSFGDPPSRTDTPTIPTTAVQTPTSTRSDVPQRSIPSSPLTHTVTKTEIGSVSNTPTTVSISSNATTIVLQATLTETSILPADSPTSYIPDLPTAQGTPQPSNVVIGVTVAIVAAFLVVTSVVLLVLYRRRRALEHDEEIRPHTMDPPLTPGSSQSIWSRYDVKRNTMLSLTTPGSSDHIPLINPPTVVPLDARATRTTHQPRIREVDAGSLHYDTYPHEYYEREGSVIVEPLPPAYEDLPPRRLAAIGLARSE